MKNILSLILAAVLLLLSTLPVFAVDLSGDGNDGVEVSEDIDISHTIGNSISNSGDTVTSDVSHTVQGGYLIIIPAKVAFVKNEQAQTFSYETEVGLGDVRVPGTLHLSISSGHYDAEKGWVLTSARGDTLKYTIKVDGADVANNGDLLSCANGTTYLKKTLSFQLEETDAKTVSYTDTLTFTVSVQ